FPGGSDSYCGDGSARSGVCLADTGHDIQHYFLASGADLIRLRHQCNCQRKTDRGVINEDCYSARNPASAVFGGCNRFDHSLRKIEKEQKEKFLKKIEIGAFQ